MSTSIKNIQKLHTSDLYLYFHEDFLTDEITFSECSYVEKHCEILPNGKILDLACGHGRHANAFAKKGYKVNGIDINKDFIKIAESNALKNQLHIEYIIGNILDINYQSEFDTIILLFNTLGFFDKQELSKLFAKINLALNEQGTVFIDTRSRDFMAKEMKPLSISERGDDLMIDRLSFDPKNGTTLNRRIYIKDGQRYDTPFQMYVYNFHELEAIINENNLKVKKVLGGWHDEEFNHQSRRMILILEKINS